MSQTSAIQWTDATHNFWRGCTKVSPGCKNCYAEALVTTRLGGKWGKGAPRAISKNFNAPIRWNKQPWICEACGMPHFCNGSICMTADCECETKHRRRVFSLSLGDWLDPEVSIEWLAQMLDVIRRCPNLTWQLVTKRPDFFFARLRDAIQWAGSHHFAHDSELVSWLHDWVNDFKAPPNIWIIASAEDQPSLDRRVPFLLSIPAIVHGLSCEPLLGPLDFKHCLGPVELESYSSFNSTATVSGGIEWVVVGGESGPRARACDPQWIRSIVKQCSAANVPCFVKQLGAKVEVDGGSAGWILKDKKGGDWNEWPADLRVRQFPVQGSMLEVGSSKFNPR